MAHFGRYEIEGKLGEGAMGVVYRARDHTLARVVALKMLSADLGGDDELHKRFEREAEAVGRLNHPNIVSVYDVGEADGHVYMAMELLEGDDLRSLIERPMDVPLSERVRILVEICDGLGYAHSRGVVHRDIKPANIIVTTAGRVKLLDFGLARVSTRATITKRGVILGTPDYMSPEQAMGKDLDHRTDIFSAGAVFYEFLTLQKPFQGKTLHSVLYQIISEDPVPILTLNPDVPARLVTVVDRMLAKDPEKRYASMDAAGKAVREILVALRRSRSSSAFWPASTPLPAGDDLPRKVREHLARGRAHGEAGRFSKAVPELKDALALDPGCEEAAEALWISGRRLQSARPASAPVDPGDVARVDALLSQVGPGRTDAEVRQALAELALLAPDDVRVREALRERGERQRT